jgi:hypothetical protein
LKNLNLFRRVLLNYQDNGDLTNSLSVYSAPAPGKDSVKGYGSPEDFLATQSFLLGDSAAYKGETVSEGGFKPNKIAAASLLQVDSKTVDGKEYYTYEVLTRCVALIFKRDTRTKRTGQAVAVDPHQCSPTNSHSLRPWLDRQKKNFFF